MSAARVLAVFPDDAAEPVDSAGYFAACAQLALGAQARLAALIVGADPHERHARHAAQAGADAVTVAVHVRLSIPMETGQLLAVLQPLLDQAPADIVVFPVHGSGEEAAARLAMRLDGAALGLCERIAHAESGWLVHKRLSGGRMQAVLQAGKGPCFVVVHAGGKPDASGARSTSAQAHSLHVDHPLPEPRLVARQRQGARRKAVEGARVVVSGGRGLDEEGFELLQRLADRLGAALGGSLPAVDAGWVPVSHQVGQSGKYVAPEIYLAVGISGTPQHMAGIAPQAQVIAINSDPDADIFRVATIGAVADWRQLLPALIERLGPAT